MTLRLLFLTLLTVCAYLCSIEGAWSDPGTTIDGTNKIELVVEPSEIDILEYNQDLGFEDVERLPYCTSTTGGQTPCRNRPNFFTAVDYDSENGVFHTLTNRGPVVDCLNFQSSTEEDNVSGVPNTEAYFVPNYSPVLTSFQVDSQIYNYFYQQLVDSQDPSFDGNNDGLPDAVDVDGDGLADVNLPLSGLPKSSQAPAIYGPFCSSEGDYPLPPDPAGLNPSGLRRIMVNGTVYYLAIEEYGPSILVIDENGKVMKAYVPENMPESNHGKYEVERSLPSILSHSQFKRSFQSLSYDWESSTLYVFYEATLSSSSVSSSTPSSTLIRVLSLDASDVHSLKYKAMYAFELNSVKFYISRGTMTADQLPHWGLVASDHLEQMKFLLVEESQQMPGVVAFVLLDLSEATNLMDFYSSDLQLEEMSGRNNLLLVDDQPLNDQMVSRFDALPRPVHLGATAYLFSYEDVEEWNNYSLYNQHIRSVRVTSPTTLLIGASNNWGYTNSDDQNSKLFFVRLSNEFVLTNQEPMAGPAGNSLTLSDSSSGIEMQEQKKSWAVIEESEDGKEWQSLENMFTVELWVYWRGGAMDQPTQSVIARGKGSWLDAHFAILYESTGVPTEAVVRGVAGCGNDIAFDYATSVFLNVGEWHHIALVVNDESSEIFVDGILSGSAFYSAACFDNSTLQYHTNAPLLIGSYSDQYGFNGLIDELRLWSVPRTNSQISSWMNQVRDPNQKHDYQHLVAYYQFNDVPNSKEYQYGYQYFASSGPQKTPRGLIMPDKSDKSRFMASVALQLESVYSVLATEADLSAPFQNTIHLTASDPDNTHDQFLFEITELSPALVEMMGQEMADEYIKFAQPEDSLDVSSLPAALHSDMLTVFVMCNSSYEPMCSSLPSQDQLWFRYSVKSEGSEESSESVIAYLSVQVCTELDECGVCMGDNSQCQCGCYHGFTAPFMDYKMFTFLLDENIAKIYEVLETLDKVYERVANRWQGGYQSTDYTKYLQKQKKFTTECLDPYCDVFNPFEEKFSENLPEFRASEQDIDTCQCSQEGPDTDDLPPLYSDPTILM